MIQTWKDVALIILLVGPFFQKLEGSHSSDFFSSILEHSQTSGILSNEARNSMLLRASEGGEEHGDNKKSSYEEASWSSISEMRSRLASSHGVACIRGYAGYKDPDLGTVEVTSEHCSPRTPNNTCPREGTFCCQPQPPEEVLSKIMFFHPDKVSSGVDVNWRDSRVPGKQFHGCKSFVYVIHGFIEDYKTTVCHRNTVETYKMMGNCVFFVEWSRGNRQTYAQSAANILTVGRIVAYTAHNWAILEKVKLVVGFSLGAQTIGVAGKFMKELTNGKSFKHCHASDPAGPLFDGCSKLVTLNPDDCEIVQVLHTSAMRDEKILSGTEATGYGTALKSGKCDYWVNCGYPEDQMPCTDDGKSRIDFMTALSKLSSDDMGNIISQQTCRHHRACLLYNAHLMKLCDFDSNTSKCSRCADDQQAKGHEVGRCYSNESFGERFMVGNPCKEPTDYFVFVSVKHGFYPYCPQRKKKV